MTPDDAKTALADLYADLQECSAHLKAEPSETVKELALGRERVAALVKKALAKVEAVYGLEKKNAR